MDFAGGEALFTPRAPGKKASEPKKGGEPKKAEPKKEAEPHDIRDAKECSPDAAETPLDQSADDRPDDATLDRLCTLAAIDTREAMESVLMQRLSAFGAVAESLATSADKLNEVSAMTSFIEKAFTIVAGALTNLGLAGLAAKGAMGVVSGLLKGTLGELGKDVAKRVAAQAEDGKVSFAMFQKQHFEEMADADAMIRDYWKVEDLRVHFMNARYPHREAAATAAATHAMSVAAYRLQLTTTLASWTHNVQEAKGGEAGLMSIEVDFAEDGSFTVIGAELPAAAGDLETFLKAPQRTGKKGEYTPLVLAELMNAAGAGLQVRVEDQSHDTYTWDGKERRITTPDAKLMHHKVMRWHAKHVGKDVVPVVGAHRFLFEALGTKSFSALGLGR